MRIGKLCVGLGISTLLLASARAEACSCPSHSAAGVWPSNGAVGVAVDTPLVVAATELDLTTSKLVAEDGTVIELGEQHRVVAPGPLACERFSYAFLKPSKELEPNTRYNLTAHIENQSDADTGPIVFERTLSFVTGTDRRAPVSPEVRWSLFGGLYRPLSDPQAGSLLLDLYVENTGAEPLFVLAHGERGVLVHDLDASGEQPGRVSFGAVPCAAFTIFDVTGTLLTDQTSCQPSKCALPDSFAESTCGGESFIPLSWSSWQTLPDGCDAETSQPSSGDAGSGAPPISDGGQAVTALPPQATRGCNLGAQNTSGRAFALSGLLFAALRLRRR